MLDEILIRWPTVFPVPRHVNGLTRFNLIGFSFPYLCALGSFVAKGKFTHFLHQS
jgi:hypothetical protein